VYVVIDNPIKITTIEDGIIHAEYIKSVSEKYKYNQRVIDSLQAYLELWKIK